MSCPKCAGSGVIQRHPFIEVCDCGANPRRKRAPEGTVERTETGRQHVFAHESTIQPPTAVQRQDLDSRNGPVQPERADDQALALVRSPQEAVEGRIIVRITVRKCGVLQDSDNCMVKPAVDQLRYAGIIPEDNPGVIKLEVEQTRVKTKAEQGTEVVILWPDSTAPAP